MFAAMWTWSSMSKTHWETNARCCICPGEVAPVHIWSPSKGIPWSQTPVGIQQKTSWQCPQMPARDACPGTVIRCWDFVSEGWLKWACWYFKSCLPPLWWQVPIWIWNNKCLELHANDSWQSQWDMETEADTQLQALKQMIQQGWPDKQQVLS